MTAPAPLAWYPVVVTLGQHVEIVPIYATDDADALAKARIRTTVANTDGATFAVGEPSDTPPEAGYSMPETHVRGILFTGYAAAHGLYDRNPA